MTATLFTSVLLLATVGHALGNTMNEFDTINADTCGQRVRRNWYSLSEDEKDSYVRGVLKLRELGLGAPNLDEYIAVASVHSDDYGAIAHQTSFFFFWHGYLLWEMESRIRALGGEWACFAMPYYDFTLDAHRQTLTDNADHATIPHIFADGHLGSFGDLNNDFTVNGFSWAHSVSEFWVPMNCFAEGDAYPLCSLKRSTGETHQMEPAELGAGMIATDGDFKAFTQWYNDAVSFPMDILTTDSILHDPVITSYDPIWYLFHSMVSYHQWLWTDCNEYDLLHPDDLDAHAEAYTPFCAVTSEMGCSSPTSNETMGMGLDDPFYFGGALQQREWSFIHQNTVTARNSYHMPRWNVIYDLEDGSGFFRDSGLEQWCDGKLNADWFMLSDEHQQTDAAQSVSARVTVGSGVTSMSHAIAVCLGLMFLLSTLAIVSVFVRKINAKKRGLLLSEGNDYGAIIP